MQRRNQDILRTPAAIKDAARRDMEEMDITDGPQELSLDPNRGIPEADGYDSPLETNAFQPEDDNTPNGTKEHQQQLSARQEGKRPVHTPAKEGTTRSANVLRSQPFGHVQDRLQATRSLNRLMAARNKTAEMTQNIIRQNKRQHEHTPSKLAATVAEEIASEREADTEADNTGYEMQEPDIELDTDTEQHGFDNTELSPSMRKILRQIMTAITVQGSQTRTAMAKLTKSQNGLAKQVHQSATAMHVFQNTIDQKLDQHASNIQLTMEAVTDVATDLNKRVEDIEQAVTAASKSVEAQQQTVEVQTKKDIHQRKAQQQLLDALDKEQREAIKHEVQVVVTDGYQGGAEGFGRLRDKQVCELLQIPAGMKARVLKREKPWTPATANPSTSSATNTRAAAQQPSESPWQPGEPCRRITVEIEDLDFVQRLAGSKAARQAFKTRTGGLLIYERLTEYEEENRRWLQKFAMGKLHEELNIKAGWRRGYVTWKVPEKNNYAVMTKLDVPENATKDDLRVIVSEISSGVTQRAAMPENPIDDMAN